MIKILGKGLVDDRYMRFAIAYWMPPTHSYSLWSDAHSFIPPHHLMSKSKQTTRPRKRRKK